MTDFIIFDIETNALVNPDKLHLFCALRDGKEYVFRGPSPELRQFIEDNQDAYWVGHNILSYDVPVLDTLLPGHGIRTDKCIDTLVLSRLAKYTLQGGHSLEAWGRRLGVKKEGVDITDWSEWTQEMEDRCLSDIRINSRLFEKLRRYWESPDWHPAVKLEHDIAVICKQMNKWGFNFSIPGALKLRQEIQTELQPLDELIKETYRGRYKLIREITPVKTKTGTLHRKDFKWWDSNDLSVFTEGAPFSLVEFEEFNPGSPKQLTQVLHEAGWRPTEKTKGHQDELRKPRAKQDKEKLERYKIHGWKVSEKNLETLPESAPRAARHLAQHLILSSRLEDINEWLQVQRHGIIHGTFNSIGAWTHRLSHSDPNLANIPAPKPSDKDTEFQSYVQGINGRMRGLFSSRKGWRLIGTDAGGIQMRIFAHHTKDRDLIEALLNGDKAKGTDIHSLHRTKLGEVCGSRDVAKTFIYAWLLGAGNGKVAEILDCGTREAKESVEGFIESYPGLKQLKTTVIPADAARGYFIGLDGRKVACDSEHLMLSGYLQNGEAVIMKRACMIWYPRLVKEKIPFMLHTWPHDEWQTGVPDDDDITEYVQKLQIESIIQAGEDLGLHLLLDGSSDWGYNWGETH